MALDKTTHPQSQRNSRTGPDRMNDSDGIKLSAPAAADDRAGTQSGGTRSPKHLRSSGHPHSVEPAVAAYEGSVTSRVFDDPGKQGISSRSSRAELPGQQKVVNAREDARAGLNHSTGKKREHD